MPAGIFDPVPLTFRDGRYLGQDNIGWDIVESAVSLLSTLVFLNERNGYMYERKLMELKEAERITFQRLRIKSLDTYGTASSIDAFEDGINCRYGGDFDDASVDNACKLAAYALTSGGAGRYAHPSRIRANDHTCEGVDYTAWNCFTVQFHPEANGGPKDTEFLFDRFIDRIKAAKKGEC